MVKPCALEARFTYALEYEPWRTNAGDPIRFWEKAGLLPEMASANATFRSDDFCFPVFINRHVPGFLGTIANEIHALANKSVATDWPAHNLFQSLGIPSF